MLEMSGAETGASINFSNISTLKFFVKKMAKTSYSFLKKKHILAKLVEKFSQVNIVLTVYFIFEQYFEVHLSLLRGRAVHRIRNVSKID